LPLMKRARNDLEQDTRTDAGNIRDAAGTCLPKLVREHEAAKLLHISVDTIRRERRRGRIGYARLGGKILYSEDQLLAYLNGQKVEPTCLNSNDRTTERSSSGTIGYRNGRMVGASSGAEPDTTTSHDKHVAHLLAQRILKRPS
jgi:excisionase family DNA binding protein